MIKTDKAQIAVGSASALWVCVQCWHVQYLSLDHSFYPCHIFWPLKQGIVEKELTQGQAMWAKSQP